jgi:hypothetical protein
MGASEVQKTPAVEFVESEKSKRSEEEQETKCKLVSCRNERWQIFCPK